MKITEKKVVTIIHAEIEFHEFSDALHNLIADVQTDRYHEDYAPARELLKKADVNTLTSKEIEASFKDSCFDVIHNAVLRYIAKSNGMSIHNYGIYDRFIQAITCSFERSGSHIYEMVL